MLLLTLIAILGPPMHVPTAPQFAPMAAEAGDPTTVLVGSGVAGACLVAFVFAAMTGRIRFRPELDSLRAENVEMKKERDDARAETAKERAEKDALRDQLMRSLPTFATAANTMVQQAVPVIQQADMQQAQVAQTLAGLLARAEKVLGDGGDAAAGTDAGGSRS